MTARNDNHDIPGDDVPGDGITGHGLREEGITQPGNGRTLWPGRRWWLRLAAIVAVVLVLILARQTMTVNAWSLRFLQHTWYPDRVALPAAPPGHTNAARWQLEGALMRGDAGVDELLVTVQEEATHAGAWSSAQFLQRDLGHWAWRNGDGATALAYWQQIGDYNSAAQVATQAEEAGDLETAYLAHRTAYAIDRVRAADELARFLARHESADEAIRVLTDARTLTDNDLFQARWLRRLGQIYSDQEAWTAAELAYRELAALPGQRAQAEIAQAWLLYRRGDGVDAALIALGRAVQAAPNDARPYYETGRLLTQVRAYGDADVWYREAMRRAPDDAVYLLAFVRNAVVAGEWRQAEARIDAGLAQFPAEARLYVELSDVYRAQDELEAAVAAMARAIELSATPNAAYHRRLAGLYSALGDAQAAQAQLDAAHRIEGAGAP